MSDTTRIARSSRLHLQCNCTYSSPQWNISQYGFTSQFKKGHSDFIQFWILSPILRSVPRVLKMCHPRCGALSVGARVHLPCTGKCLHHSRRCSPGLRRTDTENYIIMKLLTRLNPSLRVSNITAPTHHNRPYWLNKVWHNSNCVKRTAPIMFTYLDWNAFLFFWKPI